MIGNFVSADYGWLSSMDGSKLTQILIKAGKNREGYFKMQDILNHANSAMNILDMDYSDKDHVVVFDNATTQLAQEEDVLSVSKMVKWTAAEGKNQGVTVSELDKNCDPVYNSKGKPLKMQVQMENAKFVDGTPHNLYWPEGHPCTGDFKGMAAILEERDFERMSAKRGKCTSPKCKPNAFDCCCYQILYFQSDLSMSHQNQRSFAKTADIKYYSSQNFSVSLILLSSAGVLQNSSIGNTLHHPKRLTLNVTQ